LCDGVFLPTVVVPDPLPTAPRAPRPARGKDGLHPTIKLWRPGPRGLLGGGFSVPSDTPQLFEGRRDPRDVLRGGRGWPQAFCSPIPPHSVEDGRGPSPPPTGARGQSLGDSGAAARRSPRSPGAMAAKDPVLGAVKEASLRLLAEPRGPLCCLGRSWWGPGRPWCGAWVRGLTAFLGTFGVGRGAHRWVTFEAGKAFFCGTAL